VHRPVTRRDRAGAGQLVEGRLLEPDRERPHRLRALLRGERGERARVHPPGEEHADGHVGDEVRAHRVPQPRPALLDQLRLVVALSRRQRARSSEPLERYPPVVPREQVAGRQLADLAEDRERRRHRVEREERLDRIRIELALRQGVELRGERQLAAHVAVVEGLDPEAVAGEDEPAPRGVPDRHREHPAQALGEAPPPLLVAVDEHLRVRARPEPMAGPLELPAQLREVVDLAVLDDGAGAVLVRDWLVAAREVDDREPPRSEPDAALDERAVRVGPAVDERGRHRREPLPVDRAPRRGDPADPAHAAECRRTPAVARVRNGQRWSVCRTTRAAVLDSVRR
jgi:hypothetical protein